MLMIFLGDVSAATAQEQESASPARVFKDAVDLFFACLLYTSDAPTILLV